MDNLVTDEVIKRRLLIDGDGVGDERRLIALTKQYVEFCMPQSSKETKGESTAFRRLISQIHQVEMSAQRTYEAIKVNEDSKAMFANLKGQVQTEIQQTKEQIVESKALLDEATKHRKYSMEYDALAKLIQSKPDRKLTEDKRIELEKELQVDRSRQALLDRKLEDRKKNLAMMSATIEVLKSLLSEEEKVVVNNLEEEISTKDNEDISPMEIEVSLSGPTSPMEQVSQEVPQTPDPTDKKVSGEVTSAVDSPSDKEKSEKYEDLSESEGEQDLA